MVDTNLLHWTLEQLLVLTIIMIRVGALIFLMPVMASQGVPTQVKALSTVMISLLLSSVVKVSPAVLPTTMVGYLVFVVSEIGIGAILAFFARFVFAAMEMAGQMVGIQMGMGMAGVMDPQFGTQVSLVGQFWNILAILLFLSVNGHHMFFRTLAESFVWVTPGTLHLSNATYEGVIQGLGQMFVLSVKIMAPVSAVLLFTNVALGILAKTVPQINLLIVSMPISIGLGFIFVGLSLGMFEPILESNFSTLERLLPKLAMGLGG